LVGLGVGPRMVGRVIGIAKAFTSRVGSGPFPSELDGELAHRLRGTGDKPWDEYGTTTGRPRRVGWLDLVMLRHAARINGLTELVITKLDILSGLDEIRICNAYQMDGETIDFYPSDIPSLSRCEAVYDTLPGWPEDVMGVRTLADLPQNAQNYIQYIADETGVPVTAVSVGPGRDQVIHL